MPYTNCPDYSPACSGKCADCGTCPRCGGQRETRERGDQSYYDTCPECGWTATRLTPMGRATVAAGVDPRDIH